MINTTLPLIDLHRHIDGNIRGSTILELGLKNNIPLPASTLEDLRPYIQITKNESSLVNFLKKLDCGVAVLCDYDSCRRIAYENVEDLVKEGINYAELRFSPAYMALRHGLHPQGVVEAVIDGVEASSKVFGVKTNLIGILSRTFGPEQCKKELSACLAFRNNLVAIDLAGDELGKPGKLFKEHFRLVRDAGLHVTIHAGEADGPESIWQAVLELGAERIGHGINAIKDPNLIDYLVKNNIGIEACLTSNVQTNSISSLAEHPIRKFLDQGVLACINTDDPAVQGIDLKHEYYIAAPAAGLTKDYLHKAQINSLSLSFLDEKEKLKIDVFGCNKPNY